MVALCSDTTHACRLCFLPWNYQVFCHTHVIRNIALCLKHPPNAMNVAHSSIISPHYQELSNSFAEVSEQRDTLSLQEAEHVARIRELEGDIQAMGEKMLQRETELDR